MMWFTKNCIPKIKKSATLFPWKICHVTRSHKQCSGSIFRKYGSWSRLFGNSRSRPGSRSRFLLTKKFKILQLRKKLIFILYQDLQYIFSTAFMRNFQLRVPSSPPEKTYTLLNKTIHNSQMYRYIFLAGLECVGHSFAYVAHFVFLRDVWIRTQRVAVASRRATNLATHLPNLATHLPNLATHLLGHPSP